VAADSRSQRDGRFLERLGYYNPLTDPAEIVVNEEKAMKWLKRGARPSDTAKSLLSKVGIWEKFINEKLGKPTPSEEAEPPLENEPAPSAEEPAPTAEEEIKEKTASETTSEESEA
jgi:small subunit ribosomal protein S16